MGASIKIILIEDNMPIASQVLEFFTGHGWEVDHAKTGELALKLVLAQPYDVVILDLNLPDFDGVSLCKEIKKQAPSDLPVLMLTARDTFEDKANGFESGADDYVTKPFEFRELALRCQALARRKNLHRPKLLTLGDLKIDKSRREAFRKEQPLKLTKTGFDILLTLAEAYPKAVTRTAMTHTLWGDNPPDSDALRAHIYSLRNTLDRPFETEMLITMINVGYKLVIGDEI